MNIYQNGQETNDAALTTCNNTNEGLNRARSTKNDEFYTQYEDIAPELEHYDLKGKSVYCPCDDYRKSQFVKCFTDNYEALGLTGLCASNYNLGDGAYKYEYDGRNTFITELQGDGDFRSEECASIRDDYDVIITNPPFSLAGDFVVWAAKKEFLILGNTNLITLKNVFPLIKKNKIWLGCTNYNTGMLFRLPDDSANFKYVDEHDNKLGRVSTSCWWTNLENDRAYNILVLNKTYNPESYPVYDDCDAIEVSKVCNIPCDYDGVMGVPITFLDKFNPDQFIILAIGSFMLNGRKTYKRILIRRRKANETNAIGVREVETDSIDFKKLCEFYKSANKSDVLRSEDGFSARFVNKGNIWNTGFELTDEVSGKSETFMLGNRVKDFVSLLEHKEALDYIEYDIDFWLYCCQEERKAA